MNGARASVMNNDFYLKSRNSKGEAAEEQEQEGDREKEQNINNK